MKIYTVSGAPRGWRVLIGLVLKQIEFEVIYLNASKQEHKQPEFLKINPRGTIPAIQHETKIITDSIAILAWLDREFPSKPLFGSSSDKARHIWQFTMDKCDYLRAAIDAALRPTLVDGIPVSALEQLDNLEVIRNNLHAECQLLESNLKNSLYLSTESPSASEAIVFPEIRILIRAIDTKPEHMNILGFSHFSQSYPNLHAWVKRVEEIPNINTTMPYQWEA